jgi:hypothetical protein
MCSRRSHIAVGAYAVLAAITLLTGGCGGAGDGDSSAPTRPCRAGAASPIDERTLLQAFAAEGIVLYREDRCHSLPGTVISLTNIGPSDDYDSNAGTEGHILCELFGDDPGVTTRRIERFAWRNDPTPTHIRVLNVSCGVFTDETAHTDAVERAFRRLPGVSRMQATVPSADAVRD